MPWFVELNRSLNDRQDDAAFRARLSEASDRLLALAGQLLERAETEFAGLDAPALRAVLAERKPAGHHGSMLFDRNTEAAPA